MKMPVFKLFWLLLCVLILEGCGQRQGGQTPESPNQERLSYEIGDADVAITGCSVFTKGELVIPKQIEGLPVTSIRDSAFTGCRSLTSITIPDSVTSIGNKTFSHCGSLTSLTIPDSVTRIGDGAFFFCSSLSSITIPDSVTRIGDSAFSSCTSLKEISVTSGNTSYKSIDGVVFSKDNKDLLACPAGKSGDYTVPKDVTYIRIEAFSGCRSLTSITIPDSVTSIGDLAFSVCTNLTSITIPDSVTSIGDHTFTFCTSLTSIAIAASITSIGDGAFLDCNSLTSISIPQAFHSEAEASRLGLQKLWPNDFSLPASTSN